jgi:signal transduction histidine kinase
MEGYVKIYNEIDLNTEMIGIVIEDSGVGISQEQTKMLFKAFTKI